MLNFFQSLLSTHITYLESHLRCLESLKHRVCLLLSMHFYVPYILTIHTYPTYYLLTLFTLHMHIHAT